MPIIPAYQRRMSIPGEASNVAPDIGSAGIVGESIARMGQAGLHVANEVADTLFMRNKEMQQENNALASLKAHNDIDIEQNDFIAKYDVEAKQQNLDPQGLAEFTNKKIGDFTQQRRKRLEQIPNVDQRIKVEAYFNASDAAIRDHTAVFQANYRKGFAANEVMKAVNTATESVRAGDDFDKQREVLTKKFGELHVAGYYSQDETVDIIKKAEQQLAVTRLDFLAVNNPLQGRLELQKYSKYLPEAQFQHFAEKIGSLSTAEEKIAQENLVTDAIIAASPDVTGKKIDVAKAILLAETAKKVGGLDMSKFDRNTRQNIVQSLRNIDAAQKEQRKAEVDVLITPVFKQLTNGSYTAARQSISKLMADPGNTDIVDNLYRIDAAADSGIKAAIRDAQVTAGEKARIKAQATSEMLNEIYSGRYQTENDVLIGAAVKGLAVDSKAWIGVFHEYNKRNGETNFWPQVLRQIESDAKEIGDIRESQGDIINSLEYYRKHPAELDKSFGDQPIDIHNPKILDVYKKFKEKAKKEAWFGYDFKSLLRTLPQGKPLVNTPKTDALSEADARKQLTGKGITGKDQDVWITKYRTAGKVK